jgi:Dyp-type peroxidase family
MDLFSRAVLPNEVVRDPRATGLLIGINLRPELSRDEVASWLGELSRTISTVASPSDGRSVASVVVAFGRSFFFDGESPTRFGLADRVPRGLAAPPDLRTAEAVPATDLLLYVMVTEEEAAARLMKGLSATRGAIANLFIDRGYQRADGRELFGFPDGVRNAPYPGRYDVVFIYRETTGVDEPDWTEDGSYMAYLKIRQDLEGFGALGVDEQDRRIGRRRDDGSRLDLPPGTDPHDEPPFPGASSDHVRKAGPRGEGQDDVQIFRRGIPYLGLSVEGAPEAGLHFVSFQATPEQFDTIFGTWMLNADFPAPGVGQDALFNDGLVAILRGGLYFVPPYDARFLGAAIFDPPKPLVRPHDVGRVIVRKRAVDEQGSKVRADLARCVFQVFDAAGATPVDEPFRTDSAGHAISGDVPVRQPLVLREIEAPPHLQASPDVSFTLQKRRDVIEVSNVLKPGTAYGS